VRIGVVILLFAVAIGAGGCFPHWDESMRTRRAYESCRREHTEVECAEAKARYEEAARAYEDSEREPAECGRGPSPERSPCSGKE
jgi:hypothetical protein